MIHTSLHRCFHFFLPFLVDSPSISWTTSTVFHPNYWIAKGISIHLLIFLWFQQHWDALPTVAAPAWTLTNYPISGGINKTQFSHPHVAQSLKVVSTWGASVWAAMVQSKICLKKLDPLVGVCTQEIQWTTTWWNKMMKGNVQQQYCYHHSISILIPICWYCTHL